MCDSAMCRFIRLSSSYSQVGDFGPRRRTLSPFSPTAAASHGDP